jgi:Family of unknown function (DUF6152)
MRLLTAFVFANLAWAHHSMAAMYDDKKPATLKGTVTAYEWQNPHVFVTLETNDATWAVELPSRLELRRSNWTRDSLKIGDSITVEGATARDGSKKLAGKSITLAGGKKLSAITSENTPAPKVTQSVPAPKWPDGHVRLGVEPGKAGYWANPSSPSLAETTAKIKFDGEGLLANIADADKVAPFQPWAKGLYVYRQKNLLKDDPIASCLAPGGPRQFQVPFGIQIVEQPDRQRIFVMSGGANRNWRLINLDGRPLPTVDDGVATYFGNSTARWEKPDTLMVQTFGYSERFWFSNGGLPHTENLKLTERISRPDFNTLKYEVTVDDPGAYTRPWTSAWTMQWIPNEEMEEYFCDDNNKDMERQAANK